MGSRSQTNTEKKIEKARWRELFKRIEAIRNGEAEPTKSSTPIWEAKTQNKDLAGTPEFILTKLESANAYWYAVVDLNYMAYTVSIQKDGKKEARGRYYKCGDAQTVINWVLEQKGYAEAGGYYYVYVPPKVIAKPVQPLSVNVPLVPYKRAVPPIERWITITPPGQPEGPPSVADWVPNVLSAEAAPRANKNWQMEIQEERERQQDRQDELDRQVITDAPLPEAKEVPQPPKKQRVMPKRKVRI
jgi:hypothetical protein